MEVRVLLAAAASEADELAYVLAAERRRQGREDDRLRQSDRRRPDSRYPGEQRDHRQWQWLE